MDISGNYYRNTYLGTMPESEIVKQLDRAEHDVDALTFRRIVFDALSPERQDLVRRAVCTQADFLYGYGEMLASPLASYGINGVSMAFDRKAITQRGGASAPAQVMMLLRSAGLTFLGVT
ncbi:MAG: hypothetical protein RSC73_00945 [Ruthenibacterium sp.]